MLSSKMFSSKHYLIWVKNEYFDVKSPNTLRSILNAYVTRNSLFHSTDGSGYKYIADKILEYDKSNPIVISRFLKIFSTFRQYENPYKRNIVKVLDYIKKNKTEPNELHELKRSKSFTQMI